MYAGSGTDLSQIWISNNTGNFLILFRAARAGSSRQILNQFGEIPIWADENSTVTIWSVVTKDNSPLAQALGKSFHSQTVRSNTQHSSFRYYVFWGRPAHRCAPGGHPRQAATARAPGDAVLAAHGQARRLHVLPGARCHPRRRRARLNGRPVCGFTWAIAVSDGPCARAEVVPDSV